MTLEELVANLMTIKGVRTMFKRVEEGKILIFWKGESPIAHVYVEADEYSIEYPKLYEMHLYDVLQIDEWLYLYVNTAVNDRELNFF